VNKIEKTHSKAMDTKEGKCIKKNRRIDKEVRLIRK
jgi:hypothetical protein